LSADATVLPPFAAGKAAPASPAATASSGSPMSPAEGWAGVKVGNYEILGTLGRGSVATVFRGRDLRLGREIAVKVVEIADTAARSRLLREARLAASLQHPALLTVLDVEEQSGRLFIFSELMSRGTLADWSAKHARAEPNEAVAVSVAVARGLAFAHRRGVTHRDVKPGNIYLGAGGTVKLGDFGLARSIQESQQLTGAFPTVERVQYAAPELFNGGEVTGAADVYSLGCVLYRLLSGRPAFEGRDVAALFEAKTRRPADLRSLRPSLNESLAETVAAALEPSAADRLGDADAFADRLKAAVGRPSMERRRSRTPPSEPPVPPVSQAPPVVVPAAPAAPPPAGAALLSEPPERLLPPETPPEPVRRVAGYEIIEEVGRGAMGVVFRARDPRLNRMVALKLLPGGTKAARKDFIRFRTEAEAVARIRHPNIVSIHEINEADGVAFLALEFVEGGTLADKIARQAQNARLAAKILVPVARGVQAAHDAGIVHRDLKPANILIGFDGVPKITDFGLAKRTDAEVSGPTGTGSMVGTLAYMAHEQMKDSRGVGPAADVYSLGAILYEMLTGRPPFVAESEIHAVYLATTRDPLPVRKLRPDCPADLETVCLKCIDRDPARRYRTAAEFADDLERFLRGEPIRARPAGAVERSVKWAMRNPVPAAAIAATALAVAVAFAAVLVRNDRLAGDLTAAAKRSRELDTALEAERRARQTEAMAAEAGRLAAVSADDRKVRYAEAHRDAVRAVEGFCDALSADPAFPDRVAPGTRDRLGKVASELAVRLREGIAQSAGDETSFRRDRARCGLRLAGVLSGFGLADAARGLLRDCVAEFEALGRIAPDDAELRELLPYARKALGALPSDR
jgi:serine/threonine protein kinase